LAALALLKRAHEVAHNLRIDPRRVAVDVVHLLALGLDVDDVQCLVAGSLVEDADREPGHGRCNGSAHPAAAMKFVLTTTGERMLKEWDSRRPLPPIGEPRPVDKPCWDGDRRQLWFGGRLVKQYRVRAESQETILAAFQEDGWPPRIDDPLPMVAGRDRHERLHNAILRLNGGQHHRLIVFRRDGTGDGVTWHQQSAR
jgi:hypothetical protein